MPATACRTASSGRRSRAPAGRLERAPARVDAACARTRCARNDRRSVDRMFIEARDGTQLYVRHVKPSDSDLIAKAWLQLSQKSQQRRFLAPKPVLTKADLRYLT